MTTVGHVFAYPSHLPQEVADQLGPFYVYALVDPRGDQIFYVGKGTGSRLLSHGAAADLEGGPGLSAKVARIKEIRAAGLEPWIDVIRHGLGTEAEAFGFESALIDTLPQLTNIVAGQHSSRVPLAELIVEYAAPPLANLGPPALLIRLGPWRDEPEPLEPGHMRAGAGWRNDLTATELYDSVRGWWRITADSVARRGAAHAVAVFEGVTRAVWSIDGWLPPRSDGRCAFAGTPVTEGAIFDHYCGPFGKRVPFPTHAQNPTHYWPQLHQDAAET